MWDIFIIINLLRLEEIMRLFFCTVQLLKISLLDSWADEQKEKINTWFDAQNSNLITDLIPISIKKIFLLYPLLPFCLKSETVLRVCLQPCGPVSQAFYYFVLLNCAECYAIFKCLSEDCTSVGSTNSTNLAQIREWLLTACQKTFCESYSF